MGGMEELLRGMNSGMGGNGSRGGHGAGGMGMLDGMRVGGLFLVACNWWCPVTPVMCDMRRRILVSCHV